MGGEMLIYNSYSSIAASGEVGGAGDVEGKRANEGWE